MLLKNSLKFSIYKENITPKKIPNTVAEVPIITPTKKNIFVIDLFNTPIDFNIAISRVLFFTKIVSPEIILNAATIMIKDKITIQNREIQISNSYISLKSNTTYII